MKNDPKPQLGVTFLLSNFQNRKLYGGKLKLEIVYFPEKIRRLINSNGTTYVIDATRTTFLDYQSDLLNMDIFDFDIEAWKKYIEMRYYSVCKKHRKILVVTDFRDYVEGSDLIFIPDQKLDVANLGITHQEVMTWVWNEWGVKFRSVSGVINDCLLATGVYA